MRSTLRETRKDEPNTKPFGLPLQALHDDDDFIRYEAAEALGALRDGQAVGPLLQALHDPGRDVRRAAARALWTLSMALRQPCRWLGSTTMLSISE